MKAQAKTIVAVSPQEFFDILVDYEAYPEFVSSMREVKVIQRSSGKSLVEFKAQIVKSISYTLELKEKRPTLLSWKLIQGDPMKKNVGSWKLKPTGKGETEATYSIEIELSSWIPVPSFVVDPLMENSLPALLDDFRNRAEKMYPKKKAPQKRLSLKR